MEQSTTGSSSRRILRRRNWITSSRGCRVRAKTTYSIIYTLTRFISCFFGLWSRMTSSESICKIRFTTITFATEMPTFPRHSKNMPHQGRPSTHTTGISTPLIPQSLQGQSQWNSSQAYRSTKMIASKIQSCRENILHLGMYVIERHVLIEFVCAKGWDWFKSCWVFQAQKQ